MRETIEMRGGAGGCSLEASGGSDGLRGRRRSCLRPRSRVRRWLVTGIVVLGLGAIGCGTSPSWDVPRSTTPPPAEPRVFHVAEIDYDRLFDVARAEMERFGPRLVDREKGEIVGRAFGVAQGPVTEYGRARVMIEREEAGRHAKLNVWVARLLAQSPSRSPDDVDVDDLVENGSHERLRDELARAIYRSYLAGSVAGRSSPPPSSDPSKPVDSNAAGSRFTLGWDPPR